MSERYVRLDLGTVSELVLEAPPLNLITLEMTRQLHAALTEVAAANGVRVVIVSGTGDRAFCAGSDIHEFERLAGQVAEGKLLLEKYVYRQLANLAVPTVAALQGDALGGGLELALCCDLRVASEHIRLGMPEVGLGVIPGSGGTQRLPRIVGLAHAKDLILTGRLVDTAEAQRIGLVQRAVPKGTALAAARELASQIATRGPVAVRAAKRLLDTALDRDLDAGLADELDASALLFDTDDVQEGRRAFFEKRPPTFRDG
ncbi:MAG TPA: enoyl-CoA hydratase-related protein [Candidatus Limnocylindrales bacterium]|nr:enoyl-CoA hydratase-related protein [Candidatus Limnocylindrales bacterium]